MSVKDWIRTLTWEYYSRYRLTILLLRQWDEPDRGERSVLAWNAEECDRVRTRWAQIPTVFAE